MAQLIENRDTSGKFQKGTSGNPGGRPSKLPELTSRCKDMTPEVLETIQGIIASGKARDSDKLAACKLVLEYGYGKSTQVNELAGGDCGPITINIVADYGEDDDVACTFAHEIKTS